MDNRDDQLYTDLSRFLESREAIRNVPDKDRAKWLELAGLGYRSYAEDARLDKTMRPGVYFSNLLPHVWEHKEDLLIYLRYLGMQVLAGADSDEILGLARAIRISYRCRQLFNIEVAIEDICTLGVDQLYAKYKIDPADLVGETYFGEDETGSMRRPIAELSGPGPAVIFARRRMGATSIRHYLQHYLSRQEQPYSLINLDYAEVVSAANLNELLEHKLSKLPDTASGTLIHELDADTPARIHSFAGMFGARRILVLVDMEQRALSVDELVQAATYLKPLLQLCQAALPEARFGCKLFLHSDLRDQIVPIYEEMGAFYYVLPWEVELIKAMVNRRLRLIYEANRPPAGSRERNRKAWRGGDDDSERGRVPTLDEMIISQVTLRRLLQLAEGAPGRFLDLFAELINEHCESDAEPVGEAFIRKELVDGLIRRYS